MKKLIIAVMVAIAGWFTAQAQSVPAPEKYAQLLEQIAKLDQTRAEFLMDATMHTLDILDDNKKGFFAMIEGSHIDHAEHANNAEQLTFEMEEFDKLLNAVFDYADTHKGTLVVVTADHETGGVTLLPGSKDFTKGDTGIDVKFSTTGHSGSPVPIYAYGASAWKFGQVMENIDIFSRIKALLIDK